MANNENDKLKSPRLTAAKKSEIVGAVAKRLLSDKSFLESTADRLLASKPFTRRIIIALMGVALITTAVYAGLAFWALNSTISKTNEYLTNQFANYVRTNDFEISQRFLGARKELSDQIAKEFETERIRAVVSSVASNRANTILTLQLIPELDRFRANVSNEVGVASRSIHELTNASTFAMILLRANADDRAAFKQLKIWAEDSNYCYHVEALRSREAIIDYHNLVAITPDLIFYPPWGTDPDPKLPFDALKEMFKNSPNRLTRIGLLQKAMERKDLPKYGKIALLVSTMHDQSDLMVLSMAGKFFRDQTGFNMKSLMTESFFKWWDENHETLDRNVETKGK